LKGVVQIGLPPNFYLLNAKRLLKILATSFTQEQEQMGEREKSGRGEILA
jgi:hypothetical protein